MVNEPEKLSSQLKTQQVIMQKNGNSYLSTSLHKKFNRIINLNGPIVATLTPFHSDGRVNLEIVDEYVNHLNSLQVKGIFAHGSTGEGLSMPSTERMALTKELVKRIRSKNSDMVIIICVSSTVIDESLEEAKFCQDLGVDAISVLPPIYYKPKDSSHLVAYMKKIASAAPGTPFIYYHIPDKTNVQVNFNEMIPEAIEKIPNFAGVKYMSSDIVGIQKTISDYQTKCKVFIGHIQTLLPMLSLGVNCAICGQFNLVKVVNLYNTILTNFHKDPKIAIDSQAKINSIVTKLQKDGDAIENLRLKIVETSKNIIDLGRSKAPINLD